MIDQDLDTTTLATDRECLEIEAKARTRKVLHWPELVRMINRMRHWQSRAEAAEKQIEEFKLERDYVWGFNAGFDEAKEQFTARAEAAEKECEDHKRALAYQVAQFSDLMRRAEAAEAECAELRKDPYKVMGALYEKWKARAEAAEKRVKDQQTAWKDSEEELINRLETAEQGLTELDEAHRITQQGLWQDITELRAALEAKP